MNGRCFCGFVRYVAEGAPFLETNCHCSTCRHVSGAPFVAWFTIPASGFRVVCGELTRFGSSQHGERTFCPRCGTPITVRSSDFPDEIDITTCSLEDPQQVPPKDHTFVSSQLEWVKLADGLPRFPQARP